MNCSLSFFAAMAKRAFVLHAFLPFAVSASLVALAVPFSKSFHPY